MNIWINNMKLDFQPGDTVLQVARRNGINIPSLCHTELTASPGASCRLCIVEVEGQPRLQTSCTLQAQDGLRIRTHNPKIQRIRRNIMELLLANHPEDCLICSRRSNCELSALADETGIRERRYSGLRKSHPIDISSPAIERDPNKCILCGKCVAVCHQNQEVGAIDFCDRGFNTSIKPSFYEGINVSDCIFCGQCTTICPTGALTEKSAVQTVFDILGNPDLITTAQIAPAVPTALMQELNVKTINEMQGILVWALKQIGFQYVFDTCFTADLTIIEETAELVHRIQNNGTLPMITSCCPGWINYVENHQPDLIPHLSTCKSPQQMAGSIIKEYWGKKPEISGQAASGKQLINISIMPCTAKKYEADIMSDVDLVLTTRELKELLLQSGIDLKGCLDYRAPLDNPIASATGAARIFGSTGGVMEAALRTAHYILNGGDVMDNTADNPDKTPSVLKVSEARGNDGLKIFALDIKDMKLNFAVVNGLGAIKPVAQDILDNRSELHFIEVMACPGGCAAGGGQPFAKNGSSDDIIARHKGMYALDSKSRYRNSHDNLDIKKLYRDFLGKPLGECSHRLLHRSYTPRRG